MFSKLNIMITVLLFVALALSITASSTKGWYFNHIKPDIDSSKDDSAREGFEIIKNDGKPIRVYFPSPKYTKYIEGYRDEPTIIESNLPKKPVYDSTGYSENYFKPQGLWSLEIHDKSSIRRGVRWMNVVNILVSVASILAIALTIVMHLLQYKKLAVIFMLGAIGISRTLISSSVMNAPNVFHYEHEHFKQPQKVTMGYSFFLQFACISVLVAAAGMKLMKHAKTVTLKK